MRSGLLTLLLYRYKKWLIKEPKNIDLTSRNNSKWNKFVHFFFKYRFTFFLFSVWFSTCCYSSLCCVETTIGNRHEDKEKFYARDRKSRLVAVQGCTKRRMSVASNRCKNAHEPVIYLLFFVQFRFESHARCWCLWEFNFCSRVFHANCEPLHIKFDEEVYILRGGND